MANCTEGCKDYWINPQCDVHGHLANLSKTEHRGERLAREFADEWGGRIDDLEAKLAEAHAAVDLRGRLLRECGLVLRACEPVIDPLSNADLIKRALTETDGDDYGGSPGADLDTDASVPKR